MPELDEILKNQRAFFESGRTRELAFRKEMLSKLQDAIHTFEPQLLAALKADLNKSAFESYETEIGLTLGEITYLKKHLKSFAKKKKVKTPLMHFYSKSFLMPEPYGCVLLMSPWNYPFMLSLIPLVGAIAAGNCALLKPSDYSKNVSRVIKELLASVFPPEYVYVAEGGRAVNGSLLEHKFDYIFFTGSKAVGRLVMEAAAKHLTPVTLELGGKSPAIVDKTANIDLAARRICWGKLLNAGQTCVAPDYVLVDSAVKAPLLAALKKYIVTFYGESPQTNADYPKIINQKHFDRLCALLSTAEPAFGGKPNPDTLQISPAILENATAESEVMQDEIFGPILPILEFSELSQARDYINAHEKPLALYLFSESKENTNKLLREVSFGGGCINDTIIHLSTSYLPFGGVGESGMGSYHGKKSFETFSHTKSILKKSTAFDIMLRYPPYKGKLSLLKKIIK